MVMSWLVKIVVGLALLGVAVVDLGSPFIARAQADDAAHEVATEAGFVYGSGRDVRQMQARCADVAASKGVSLVSCELAEGKVLVRVKKQAYSLVLHRVPTFKSWYEVQVSATAEPK